MSTVKRHAPGLYTVGDIALSRECDCSGYCDSRWVARDVLRWSGEFPVELGDWGETANTRAELLEMLLTQD